jgi:HK97 family phage portal protein
VKLFRRRETRATSSLATPDTWLFDAAGAQPTMAGERVSVEGSMAIAAVFTAVSIISETIGTLPLKTFRDLGADKGVAPAPDHRAYRMLHSAPNPIQPAHRFWSTVVAHQLLWGNWFIEKLRDADGLVAELWLLNPANVVVEWNSAVRRKRFRYTDPMTGVETLYDDDRILHGFGLSLDGITGMSPIQQARESLGKAKARARFEADLYARAPSLSGWIGVQGQLKDSVKLRESWRAIYGAGGDDRFGVGVLEEGATFNALTAPLADMQFVESENMSVKAIASLFKLPPAYLGGSTGDSLTYATTESNSIQLATQAIAPVTHNIARWLTFDMGIFPFSSWFAEFELDALMRGDSAARAVFYEKMVGIKALFPDEIRRFENLAPDDRALEQPAPTPALPAPDPTKGVSP